MELARWKYGQKEIFDMGFQIKENFIEKIKVLKYESNTAIIWVNSPRAIHGVTPREPSPNSRRLIYLSGRVGKKCFPDGIFPNAKQKLTFVQKFIINLKIIFKF